MAQWHCVCHLDPKVDGSISVNGNWKLLSTLPDQRVICWGQILSQKFIGGQETDLETQKFDTMTSLPKEIGGSATRLGKFWKLLGAKYITKVAQMYGDYVGYFEKHFVEVKTAGATFWQLLCHSDHTDRWRPVHQKMTILDLSKRIWQFWLNRKI